MNVIRATISPTIIQKRTTSFSFQNGKPKISYKIIEMPLIVQERHGACPDEWNEEE
ncbi:hypothetical protein [Algoriphagus sp. Y33]|uniref:hypothetical protein n=1 Tax=Algoriphagus sp. Y33 TaxID=2772483 RepID=UPI00177C9932|nr:hypothetical protein [Algoriphagus sp. Y33]